MSLYLAVEIDDESKKLLNEKQVYLKQNAIGNFEDPTRFHITVRYLSKDEVNNKEAIEGLKLFDKLYHPSKFEIIAKDFHRFDKGVEWIGVDNSLPLYEIKYQIEDCLLKSNFPLKEDKFKGYTPHITMGYDVEELSTLNNKFEGIPIIINNISLWNGFKANGEHIHSFIYRVNFK